jgi:chromosome partitioning protein
MALPADDWTPGEHGSSAATQIISKDVQPNQIASIARRVDLGADTNQAGRLDIITAYYDLAQADNRLLVEWLLKCRQRSQPSWAKAAADLLMGKLFRTDDVRYTLAEVLHSEPVRKAYDLIILDCPPRLTTSEIQALCAASHVLIPTILDRPSAQAVISLCQQIETLKAEGICPHLQYAGVVATKWKGGQNAEKAALQFLSDAITSEGLGIGILDNKTFVPMTTQIVENAADGIAYLAMSDNDRTHVREAIEALATQTAGLIGLQMPALAVTGLRRRA